MIHAVCQGMQKLFYACKGMLGIRGDLSIALRGLQLQKIFTALQQLLTDALEKLGKQTRLSCSPNTPAQMLCGKVQRTITESEQSFSWVTSVLCMVEL